MKRIIFAATLFGLTSCAAVTDLEGFGLGIESWGAEGNLECWAKQRTLRKLIKENPKLLENQDFVKALQCKGDS